MTCFAVGDLIGRELQDEYDFGILSWDKGGHSNVVVIVVIYLMVEIGHIRG